MSAPKKINEFCRGFEVHNIPFSLNFENIYIRPGGRYRPAPRFISAVSLSRLDPSAKINYTGDLAIDNRSFLQS